MNMNQNQSIDSILDSTLDDLADLPEFKPFPAGAHRCIFNWESKTINNKPCVELKFVAIETIESSDPQEAVVNEGQTTNILLMLRNNDGGKNEISEGQLKLVVAALKPTFGGDTNGQTLEAARGAEVLLVSKVRVNKSSGQENTALVSLSVI